MQVYPNSTPSMSPSTNGRPRPELPTEAEIRLQDVAEISHQLMSSVSALLLCQHLIEKEIQAKGAASPSLTESLGLLKESIDQVHQYGDRLMVLSRDQKG